MDKSPYSAELLPLEQCTLAVAQLVGPQLACRRSRGISYHRVESRQSGGAIYLLRELWDRLLASPFLALRLVLLPKFFFENYM